MEITRSIAERLAMMEVTSVLVALLCMLGQVAGMPHWSCGVDARPHINGICGDNLIRARNNLCFLLYSDYPDHFGKRSVNDLYSYPVKAFADMDLLGGNVQDDQAMGADKPSEETSAAAITASADGKLYLPLLPKPRASSPRPSAVRRGGGAAAKRADEELTHVQKRGMVCDCCFNECMPSVLARYC